MVNWSYVRSTDCNGVSHRQKITCCIDVPVVVLLTFRAVPFTDIQRQRFLDVTAIPTALTAGEPTVNFDKSTSVPFALIFELSYQLSPSGIRNTKCQLVVFDHVLNCQIFNYDGLVFAHELGCQFMEKVETAIRNLAVNTGSFNSCLVSIVLQSAQRFTV